MTLKIVKEYLRLDDDSEDGYLRVLILLSSEICLNYMRMDKFPSKMPKAVKQARLLTIGYFFENREATKDDVPKAVFSLLDPYRKAAF